MVENMNAEALLRFANDAFYQAFRDRELEAMDRLWARRLPLLCAHPGARPLYDRDAVLESWNQILGNPNCPVLECRIERIHWYGELALIAGYEWSRAQPTAVLFAMNGFQVEDGDYRLVLHQAGPVRGVVLSADPAPRAPVH